MDPRKVAIIILNWNGKEDTIECLESLRRVKLPEYRILLIDNASTDGSVELFRQRYPDVELVVNERNLGFAGGNNVGIKKAVEEGSEYVLLLNNDTVVYPDFLSGLIDLAESRENIGFVGPKICFFSDPDKIWTSGGTVNLFTGRIGDRKKGMPQASASGAESVDYLSGCALLARASMVRHIGLMDEDYFLYFEDTDWTLRARRQGYTCLVNNDVRILHKVGASVKKVKGSDYYYVVRNLPRFVGRNGKWYHKMVFYPAFFVRYSASYALHAARGEREVCRGISRGLRDFFKGKYGKY